MRLFLLAVASALLVAALPGAASAATLDTRPSNSTLGTFGDGGTNTYGQTFTVEPGEELLERFSVFFELPPGLDVRGYLYEWDDGEGRATGTQLYRSGIRNTPDDNGISELRFAPNVVLETGVQYVFFVSISEEPSNQGTDFDGVAATRSDDPYAGGELVYFNDDYEPERWTTDEWDGTGNPSDLALVADFAAPDLRDVLVVTSSCNSVGDFVDELEDRPGIGVVNVFDAGDGDRGGAVGQTPDAATLAAHDLVVSSSNCEYGDPVLYGNRLADYVDGGGRLLQFAYDTWDGGSGDATRPLGRFESGGYGPFLPGPNDNETVTLGERDPAHPLLAGVDELTSNSNTTSEARPGADLVASWSDGRDAIATKGRVVASTTGLDDGYWSGDLVRFAQNVALTAPRPTGGDDEDDGGSDDDGDELVVPVEIQGAPLTPPAAEPGSGIDAGAGGRTATLSRGGILTIPGLTERCGVGPCAAYERMFRLPSGAGAAAHQAGKRHGLIARDRDTLASGQVNAVRVRLTRSAAASLRKRGRMRVEVLVTVTDARGRAQTVRRKLTLRARR